jgi:lysophospholipase L1-like esterase
MGRVLAYAAKTKAPTAPFRACPAIGADQSCGVLIYITNSGTQVLSDPSQGPYDSGDDTLVGVLNASSQSLSSLSLSSNSGIFGFDGDGLCSYSGWDASTKCPFGPTGYEGLGTAFGATNGNSGPVVFSNSLPPGGVAYFGLESALSQATLTNTRSYAALGDSYSAGVGTENSSFSPSCDRGPKAWPMFLGSYAGLSIDGNPASSSNSFFACSGATSSDMLHGSRKQPNQVLELESYAALNGVPGLVTVTAGGNDMKFADLLETCYIWGGHACSSALHGGLRYLTTGQKNFEQRLVKLYEGSAKAAGPGARIEVVGYPRIFPSSLSWFQLLHHCDWLATVPNGLNLIRQITSDLDNDIRQAAAAAHVAYASTENALAGHELCTGGSWVASIGPVNGLIKHTSGHPQLPGQEALASAVLQDLRNAGLPFATARHGAAQPSIRRPTSVGIAGPRAQPAEGPLKIALAEVPDATVGGPYLGYLTAAGGTEPYAWSVSKGSLPAGLALDENTGVISGEPTMAGSETFTVTVTDVANPAASASQAVTILTSTPAKLSVATESVPQLTVGQHYETTLASSGGTQPVTWKLESGNLPTGVSLDPQTGTVSGTPSASGETKATFSATDSGQPTSQIAARTLAFNTAPESQPLVVTSTTLPSGTAGAYYGANLTSTGGTAPITWSITKGSLPEGVTLDSSSGEISGVPSSAGKYPVTVSATDRTAPTAEVAGTEVTITVATGTPLSILTTSVPGATQGSEYVASLNADGGVAGDSWQTTAGSLPPGLTLDSSSGTIEGTPTESGSFAFTATVSDSSTPSPQTASGSYAVVVAPSSPSIGFAAPEATVNIPYSYTPSVTGGVAPYSWSVSSGELPAGLSLNPSTGAITGTPTATGSTGVTLRVADSSQPVAQSVTSTGSLTVAPAPALQIESAALPAAIDGAPYRALVFVSGGTAPLTFSITHGALPASLSLDPGSGVISGTPSSQGSSEFTLQVSDASKPSQVRTGSFTVTVGPPPALAIVTSELQEASAGASFSQALIATGGSMPYSWSITSGALPAGLTLSASTGQISGAPTEGGTFSFSAKVTDSGSPTPHTATVPLNLVVTPPSPLRMTTSSLASGTQGVYYDIPIEAQGGVQPFRWSFASGALPDGLSLDPNSGAIYGLPTSYGTYSFSVQVADSSSPAPATSARSYSIRIAPAPPLAVSATSLRAGAQGQYYSQSLGVSGGVAPYPASVTSGSLPEGLSIGQYGEVYGEITSAQTRTFTVLIHDGSTPKAQTISRQHTIEVAAAPPLELASPVGSFVLGQYGSRSLALTGGVPGYSWTVKVSKLPAGLSFSGGTIYGTPTKIGKGTLTVTATDSATPTAHSVTRTLTVAVAKPPKLVITTKKLPTATHGSYYQQPISVTGGSPPDTWSLSGGALPSGMSLSGESIYGTPESAGTHSFTIRVTDSGSPKQQTVTKTLTLKVI